MNKKPLNHKPFKQRKLEALNSLPIHDVKSIEDAHAYASMSIAELSKLESFNEDGTVKMYEIGDILLGKLALIEFVKTIKNR